MAHFLNTADADFEDRFLDLLTMKREDAPDVNRAVADIIADVVARGDAALIDLTAKFDHMDLTPETFAFSAEEMASLYTDQAGFVEAVINSTESAVSEGFLLREDADAIIEWAPQQWLWQVEP